MAAARAESTEALQAMAALCMAYRYPLYAYARRRGLNHADAEDRTHDFFAERIIPGLIFKGVHPERGKFRTWLLNSFDNFLNQKWEREKALKRGGGHEHVSLDLQDADHRYLLEPAAPGETPEKLYDRAWAITLMDRALVRLRDNYERAGELPLFHCLARYLPGALNPPAYEETAQRLGKTEAAVKMAVSRLRREYGNVLKQEVRRTLSDVADVREELRHLAAAMSD